MTKHAPQFQGLDVVFAHDWLNGMRGGERVLEILCGLCPDAFVYTLLARPELLSDAYEHPDGEEPGASWQHGHP